MLDNFAAHNLFWQDENAFFSADPQLSALNKLKFQYRPDWWQGLSLSTPGIYILTGGRQVGKSTSCKLLLEHCLKQKLFETNNLFYLPCDEIFDAKTLSQTIRYFLEQTVGKPFLIIIDEVTFTPQWERVIKALADEGCFQQGLCLLTGSDTLILKEAAMSFPGRRGTADKTDFHLFPLNFHDYVSLLTGKISQPNNQQLAELFTNYLKTGGYLRAINNFAESNSIDLATEQTYQQWVRGDFLKRGKNEDYLKALLRGLINNGVSQISFSALTQKIGLLSKETLIDYYNLLERMDICFNLQVYDQNKKQGFPRKARKFHFVDPFIQRCINHWLNSEGQLQHTLSESELVEACVASHCQRFSSSFYFKGTTGEVDVIRLQQGKAQAIEIKWAEQFRSNDLKTLQQFPNRILLGKQASEGVINETTVMPVYQFLYQLSSE
jgi:predicted AAA+ superfamily ATPase